MEGRSGKRVWGFLYVVLLLSCFGRAQEPGCADRLFDSTLDATENSTGSIRSYLEASRGPIVQMADLLASHLLSGLPMKESDSQLPMEVSDPTPVRRLFGGPLLANQLSALQWNVVQKVNRDRSEASRAMPDVEQVEVGGSDDNSVTSIEPTGFNEFYAFFEVFLQRMLSARWEGERPSRRTKEFLGVVYRENRPFSFAITPLMGAEHPFSEKFINDVTATPDYQNVPIVGTTSFGVVDERDPDEGGFADYRGVLTEVLFFPLQVTDGLPLNAANGKIIWAPILPENVDMVMELVKQWRDIHLYPYGWSDELEGELDPLHLFIDSRFIYLGPETASKMELPEGRLSDYLRGKSEYDFSVVFEALTFKRDEIFEVEGLGHWKKIKKIRMDWKKDALTLSGKFKKRRFKLMLGLSVPEVDDE